MRRKSLKTFTRKSTFQYEKILSDYCTYKQLQPTDFSLHDGPSRNQ